MNRPLLIATGLFYVGLGFLLLLSTPQAMPLHNLFASLIAAELTRILFAVGLIAAGVATLGGSLWFHCYRLRQLAAGMRAGSMCGLTLLLYLAFLFIPGDETVAGLMIFTYLSLLALMTTPPAVPEPLVQALHEVQAQQQEAHDAAPDSPTAFSDWGRVDWRLRDRLRQSADTPSERNRRHAANAPRRQQSAT